MCKITIIQHPCGHQSHRLHSHCTSFLRFHPNSPDRIPSFCLSGLEVVEKIQDTTECSNRKGPSSLSCSERKALKPLQEVLDRVWPQIRRLAERVNSVKLCAKRADGVYDFKDLAQFGWNPDSLERASTSALTIQIPEFLQLWENTLDAKMAEIECTFENLAERICREISGPTSRATQCSNYRIASFEEYLEEVRDELYAIVAEIEAVAAEACLEREGWTWPEDDPEQCQSLKISSVWKAESAELCRPKPTLSVSDTFDELDTAPMEDPWLPVPP
jgi:hypothetical protein